VKAAGDRADRGLGTACSRHRPPGRLDGFGLEELGIPPGRTIETDRPPAGDRSTPTSMPPGDVGRGPYQLHPHGRLTRHWYAARQTPCSAILRAFQVEQPRDPATTFCDPEVASVGAHGTGGGRLAGSAVEVTRFSLAGTRSAPFIEVHWRGSASRRLCEGAHPAWQRTRSWGHDRG